MVGQPQGVGGAILKGLLAGQAVKTGEKADELASDRTNKLKELIQQQIDVAQKNQALKQKVEMQKVLKEEVAFNQTLINDVVIDVMTAGDTATATQALVNAIPTLPPNTKAAIAAKGEIQTVDPRTGLAVFADGSSINLANELNPEGREKLQALRKGQVELMPAAEQAARDAGVAVDQLSEQDRRVAAGLESPVKRVEEGGPGSFAGVKNVEAKAKLGGAMASAQSVNLLKSIYFDEKGGLKKGLVVMNQTGVNVTPEAQAARSAAFDAIEGGLRLATGAQMPESEIKNYAGAYLPTVFDDATSAAFKLNLYERRLNTIAEAAQDIPPGLPAEKRQEVLMGQIRLMVAQDKLAMQAINPEAASRGQQPIKEGDVIVNPSTGERMVWKDGKWQKM